MSGIYIHFPFCKKKCIYCNFFSIATSKLKEKYLAALLKEVDLQKNYLNSEKIHTIYFGGGTPSLMSIDEVCKIIEYVKNVFCVLPDSEITLEANPDDLSVDYVSALANSPVNRVSVGVQSFINDELNYLGRIHSAVQSMESIHLLKKNGITNISLDLIYGITSGNEGMKNIERNLQDFFELDIPHLSAYALTVEPQTIFSNHISKNKKIPVDEDSIIEQFGYIMQQMNAHGYLHYEISNFCKDGYFSKHNTSYWQGKKYLGLGTSAHSFNIKSRQWNISSIEKYMDNINQNVNPCEMEILSQTEQLNDYILTSLRTMWGCDLTYIKSNFNENYYQNILLESDKYILKEYMRKSNNILYLTEKGKIFADKISSDLFAVS